MGTYMYLGGYFSRRALARKSREGFVKDRLYRLGLPTLAYTAIGAPMCAGIVRAWQGDPVNLHWLIDYWKEQRGIRGPVWFTATLLCFDLGLVAFDRLQSVLYTDSSTSNGPPPRKNENGMNPLKLYASIALCSITDFFVRTVYPVGSVLNPLKLQPAYLSQYIATYSLGASVSDFDAVIPTFATSAGLLLTSLASGLVLFQGLKDDPTSTAQMAGGRNNLAAAYALWNNANGYLVGSCVLAAFKRYSTTSWGAVNAMAFPAFLVHMPVITLLGVATDKWNLGPVTKTAVIGVAGVVGSWIVGDVANRLWLWAKGVVGGQRRDVLRK